MRLATAAALGFAFAGFLAAQNSLNRPVVRAAPRAGEIRIDGVLDEPAWRDAGVIADLVQQAPRPGERTPYRTEVRILTDPGAIYVGVTCEDPDPGRIALRKGQR